MTFTSNGKSLVIYSDETKNHVLMKLTEFAELTQLVDNYKFDLFYEQAMAKIEARLGANNSTEGDQHD